MGRVITQDDVMITYLAQDLRTEKIYALREYFPAAWAVRSGDGIHVKVQEGQMQNFSSRNGDVGK